MVANTSTSRVTRLSADELLLHRRRYRCRLRNPADRNNREAGDSNQAVLA